MFCTLNCCAQTTKSVSMDTIRCDYTCITKFVEVSNSKGTNIQIYAVYNGETISDLIPVSKSVYSYIQTCIQNGIQPQLGIKLKNGQIYSIIKFKKKYKKQ